MINRSLSSSLFCALALSIAAAPVTFAQTNTPAPAAPTTAPTPAAPEAPVVPANVPPPISTTQGAPAAAPTDTTTPSSAERPTTYTMEAGDSLDSIAKKFNTSIHALAKLNKIPKSEYRKLRAGKVLQIPPATPSK